MYFSLQNGQTALRMASFNNCVECVRLLLEKGADFNIHDNKVSAVSQSIIVCLTCSLVQKWYSGTDLCAQQHIGCHSVLLMLNKCIQ